MITSKIHIFFHCFAHNDWEDISRSLLQTVRFCKVNCTLIGKPEDERKLKELSEECKVEMTVRRFPAPEVYEHEAMLWLKENAAQYPNGYTLYFHTKGAANPSQINTGWRLDMIYSVLWRWRSGLQQLQDSDSDITGLWFGYDKNDEEFGGEETMFFAGNFWIARNAYLFKLPDYRSLMEQHKSSRYLPERYVGFGNPKVLFINQSETLPVKGKKGIQWKVINRYSDQSVIKGLRYLIKVNTFFDLSGFTRQIGRQFLERISKKKSDLNSLKIGIVIHVFYLELFDIIIDRLLKSGCQSDLIITCPDAIYEAIEHRRQVFSGHFRSIEIFPMENKGRDILPFLKLGDRIMKYDSVCKLHTKKSGYSPELSGWFDFLIDKLIGNDQVMKGHMSTFQRNKKIGIISPGWFSGYPGKKYNWGSNQERVNDLIKRLGLGRPAPKAITFPAGSMFWFRPDALEPLLSNGAILGEFEEENGQLDGTCAHAIERMFHLVAERSGFKVKILSDTL